MSSRSQIRSAMLLPRMRGARPFSCSRNILNVAAAPSSNPTSVSNDIGVLDFIPLRRIPLQSSTSIPIPSYTQFSSSSSSSISHGQCQYQHHYQTLAPSLTSLQTRPRCQALPTLTLSQLSISCSTPSSLSSLSTPYSPSSNTPPHFLLASTTRPAALFAHHALPPTPTAPAVRRFHSSPSRSDIFFVAFPALKGFLLTTTRVGLLTLPFVWRWRLWKRYRKFSMILINVPLLAFCLVLALGLDQCSRTERWRLLLMTEHEEMTWSRRKFEEVIAQDGPRLLTSSDPRVQMVARVATRLITALEEDDRHLVHGASWPPRGHTDELAKVMDERQKGLKMYEPSATATSGSMPFRPDSRNPLKMLEQGDWNIWVVDSPTINAFALPSKDIFVYTGLVDLVDDDTLLSAVLAHEIAHVTQRHAVENMGFLNLAAVAFDVLRGISFALTISFPLITDSAAVFINWVNDVVAQRAYSRKLEMEADQVGLTFMAEAGYDPRAAVDLWDLMAAVEADSAAHGEPVSITDRLSLLHTHPTSQKRQEELARLLPKALKIYSEAIKAKSHTTSWLSTTSSLPPMTSNANGMTAAVGAKEKDDQSQNPIKHLVHPSGAEPTRSTSDTKPATNATSSLSPGKLRGQTIEQRRQIEKQARRPMFHASLQTTSAFSPRKSNATALTPPAVATQKEIGQDAALTRQDQLEKEMKEVVTRLV